jgi:hypothetical protein
MRKPAKATSGRSVSCSRSASCGELTLPKCNPCQSHTRIDLETRTVCCASDVFLLYVGTVSLASLREEQAIYHYLHRASKHLHPILGKDIPLKL